MTRHPGHQQPLAVGRRRLSLVPKRQRRRRGYGRLIRWLGSQTSWEGSWRLSTNRGDGEWRIVSRENKLQLMVSSGCANITDRSRRVVEFAGGRL